MSRFPTTDMCSGAILEAFEPTARDTDVFCATAAKCGQTWLLALMHHLRTRGHDPELGGKNLVDLAPWLELPFDVTSRARTPYDVAERLAAFEHLPDPRIFKLHVIWEEIPRAPGRGRVVTITRDPRELPYSMYCHLKGWEGANLDCGFDEYFERWIEFGYFFHFVRSFWPHRHDEDVLWLRYDDLKADLPGQARRLAAFLGFELDDADFDRVLPLVDFAHMRATERKVIMRGSETAWKADHQFFREGAVGKNRERLSPEQERRIVERMHRELDGECVDFVMTLDRERDPTVARV